MDMRFCFLNELPGVAGAADLGLPLDCEGPGVLESQVFKMLLIC